MGWPHPAPMALLSLFFPFGLLWSRRLLLRLPLELVLREEEDALHLLLHAADVGTLRLPLAPPEPGHGDVPRGLGALGLLLLLLL